MSLNLGKRIAIIGPSCSGKSTLASLLAARMNVPVLHLDQAAHHHGSNWQRIPDSELIVIQKEFLLHDSWVVEGNYRVCMPERFAKADTVLWLDPPLTGCMWRYLLRCMGKGDRHGGLPGATKEFSWALIRYTFNNYPKNKAHYERFLAQTPHLQVIRITSFRDVKLFMDTAATQS